MSKLSVAVALVFAVGCSKKAEKSPTEKIKDAVCACTTKACAEALIPEYDATSKAEAAKAGGWTKADHENMNAAANCLDKYMLAK